MAIYGVYLFRILGLILLLSHASHALRQTSASTEKEIRRQTEKLQVLRTQLEKFKEPMVHRDSATLQRIKELADRLDLLQQNNEKLLEELKAQKTKDEFQYKRQRARIARLGKPLKNVLKALRKKNAEVLRTFGVFLLNNLDELMRQSTTVGRLVVRMNDLQKAKQRKSTARETLQPEVNDLQQAFQHQEANTSSLQEKLMELRRVNEELKAAVNYSVGETIENTTTSHKGAPSELRKQADRFEFQQNDRTDNIQTAFPSPVMPVTDSGQNAASRKPYTLEELYQVLSDMEEHWSDTLSSVRSELKALTSLIDTNNPSKGNSSGVLLLQTRLNNSADQIRNSHQSLRQQMDTLHTAQANFTFGIHQETESLHFLLADRAKPAKDKNQQSRRDYQDFEGVFDDTKEEPNFPTNHDLEDLKQRLKTERQKREDSYTMLRSRLGELSARQEDQYNDLQEEIGRLQSGKVNFTVAMEMAAQDVQQQSVTFTSEVTDKSNYFEEYYQYYTESVEDGEEYFTEFRSEEIWELTHRLQTQTHLDSFTPLQKRLDNLSQTLHEHMANTKNHRAVTGLRISDVLANMTSLMTSSDSHLPQDRDRHMTTLQSMVHSLDLSARKGEVTLGTLQSRLAQLKALEVKLHPVRLANGASNHEGTVEILVGHQWGTVCGHGWDNNDATVVCGMLGHKRFGARATHVTDSQDSGPIVLDDVACRGDEQDIRLCQSSTFGVHNCVFGKIAGVICEP